MRKYKETAATTDEPPALVPLIPCSRETPAYMSLAEQYGLEDDMDVGSSANTQSVEQEYQAYITAPLSSKKVDIVKFWEVSSEVDKFIL